MAGFLNQIPAYNLLMGGESPGYDHKELDADSQAILSRQTDYAANHGANAIAQDYKNAANTSGFLNQSQADQGMRDHALASSGPDSLSQAIQARANRDFDSSSNDRNRKFDLQAPIEASRKIEIARQGQLHVADVYRQQAARQMMQQQQADASRNAAIGNIIGLAGTVGGFMVGGPAGAQMGSQLGSGMSQPPPPMNPSGTDSGFTYSDPHSQTPSGYQTQNFGRIGR